MTEIKFRGKRIDTGEWVYGDLTHYSQGQVSIYMPDSFNAALAKSVGFDVLPESVGQYSGLKDKNDKEIYDGDILRYEHDDEIEQGVIHFSDGHFQIEYAYSDCFADIISWSEIIGNKYENPELLKTDVL